MERWSFFNNIYIRSLLGLILVSVLLVSLVLLGLNTYTQHGKTVEVPNVKGLSVKNAKSFFADRKLNYLVVDSVSNQQAIPGTIAETTPAVGSKVKKGRTIYLKVVAFLPQLIAIPDVKHTSQRQSMAMLRSLGFENIEIKTVPGAYKELVLGIESRGLSLEAGKRVPVYTPLSLLVSSGSEENLFLDNPIDSFEINSDEIWF